MKQKNQISKTADPTKVSWIWIMVFAIASGLITYAAYLPSLKNKFTNWDDDRYVVENKDIRSLDKENLKLLLSKEYEGNYHPLTMLSYAWNYQTSKLSPKGYIQTNIWLHVLNTVLVFILIQKLFHRLPVSFITSLLFGIHPLHVESVAWISERKDVLYCFFFLLSIIAYVNYCRKSSIPYYLLALVLFSLSLLSKGMAVSLAVSLFLIDYILDRKSASLKILLEKIPFFITAIGFGILAIRAQQVKDLNPDTSGFSFVDRIAIAGNGFTTYILKLLFPFKLSALYPYPEKLPAEFWLYTFISVVLTAAIIFYGINYQKKNQYSRYYLAGFLFFLFNIALVLQLLPVGKAMMADRYTYVASIGFFWMIGMLIHQISETLKEKQILAYLSSGAYVIFLFLYTQNQCKVWNNSVSLWNNVIRHYPETATAYLNRGLAKHHKDEKEEAIHDYKKAVAISPEMFLAWNNLGSIHSELGKHQEALPFFDKAIELDSDFANCYMNRAKTLAALNDFENAIKDYTRYLQFVPENPDILNDRGLAYYQLSQLEKARGDYDKAIAVGKKLKSGNLGIYHLNRGLCRAFLKDYEGALQDYTIALRLHPNPGTVYYNQGILHCFLGDFNKGCEDLKKAETLGMAAATEKIRSYCKN